MTTEALCKAPVARFLNEISSQELLAGGWTSCGCRLILREVGDDTRCIRIGATLGEVQCRCASVVGGAEVSALGLEQFQFVNRAIGMRSGSEQRRLAESVAGVDLGPLVEQ